MVKVSFTPRLAWFIWTTLLLCFILVVYSNSHVSAAGITYYVDNSLGDDTKDGKCQTVSGSCGPWKTLAKVNATTFAPGDRILFKSGGVWTGQLYPKGSGSSAGGAIVIDKYGSGNKPIINAAGAVREAFMLRNQQYWEVNNLELTN